jgi:pSer/pThr/pTyr-binding forkhead associated (FHA) protein
MIIYCEECGFKNTIDEARVKGPTPQLACAKCGDFLRFYGLKAKALKARPPRYKTAPRSCLILKYGKVVVLVNETNTRVEIGRQKSNDIQVVNNRVSRTHALIEYKNGQYYLTDQSSNGTYLLMEGHKGISVKKKEIMLTAKGVIGPGYKVDFKSADAIHIIFDQTR